MLMRYVGGNPIEFDTVDADGLPMRLELCTGGEVEVDEQRAAVFLDAVDMWVSVSGEIPVRVDPPAPPAERKG